MRRREFLKLSAAGMGAVGSVGTAQAIDSDNASGDRGTGAKNTPWAKRDSHAYDGEYRGECLNHVAFPLGGIGAGMICLEGTGALSHVSLRNRPEIFNEPCVFAAISVSGKHRVARV